MLETHGDPRQKPRRREACKMDPSGTSGRPRRDPALENPEDFYAVPLGADIIIDGAEYERRKSVFGPAVLIRKTALRRRSRRTP